MATWEHLTIIKDTGVITHSDNEEQNKFDPNKLKVDVLVGGDAKKMVTELWSLIKDSDLITKHEIARIEINTFP